MADFHLAGAEGQDFRKSTDGGDTWVGEDNTGTEDVYSIHGLSQIDLWAACESGFMHHWNGTVWDRRDAVGGVTMHGVHMIATDKVWAVGAGSGAGEIWVWNGTSWGAHSTPAGTNDFYGIWALDSNNVWVVGSLFAAATDNARIWKWNGSSWSTEVSLGVSNERFYGIWGADASNIWAGGWGTSASLLRYFNGSTWADISGSLAAPDLAIYGVAGADASNVWVCGLQFSVYNGRVQYFNGSTWADQYTNAGKRLDAIWADPSGNLALTCGESGTLAKWVP
jgi:hypothetical protein